ncbi:MAG: AMP-binding protein [Clostridia bacterium]|nr:AMP-binding protein [Clostridia bacterium]
MTNKVKKNERRYTPAWTMRDMIKVYESHGDKVAFRYYATPKELAEMSYTTFVQQVRATAAGFEKLGLVGKRIAIIGETSPNWIATYLAAVASGSVAVPLDKELIISDLEGLLASAEVDVLVFSKSYGEKFAPAHESHPTLKYFIPMDAEGLSYADSEKVIPLASVIEAGKQLPDYDYPVCEDTSRMAEMLFTSGTTGSSKCVMLSEKNVIAAVNSACATVNFTPEDSIVSVLPIHHTYELCCLLAGLDYGITIGINDSLKRVLHNFKLFAPTGLVLVPLFVNTIYKKIFDEARKSGREKKLRFGLKLSRFLRHFGIDIRRKLFADVLNSFGGNLSKIICGGAPMNPKMSDVFFEFGIQICEGYGITECSPLISVTPYYAPKPGSVGPAVPNCEVRIEANGEILPVGETGEIVVKGDNVMLGYYNNPEANAQVFTEDGWFRTGDMGHLDKDGYIYITGRYKSVIVLENGNNVFPEEIEEHLENIEGVLETVVVGRKAEDGETVVLTAIIVPDMDRYPEGASDEAILADLQAKVNEMNKRLASFKHVRAVEIRHEEFEKTTSRKIRRHLVK